MHFCENICKQCSNTAFWEQFWHKFIQINYCLHLNNNQNNFFKSITMWSALFKHLNIFNIFNIHNNLEVGTLLASFYRSINWSKDTEQLAQGYPAIKQGTWVQDQTGWLHSLRFLTTMRCCLNGLTGLEPKVHVAQCGLAYITPLQNKREHLLSSMCQKSLSVFGVLTLHPPNNPVRHILLAHGVTSNS